MKPTPRLALALLWRIPLAFLHGLLTLAWMVFSGVAGIFAAMRDEVGEVLDTHYERRTKARKAADRSETFRAKAGRDIERITGP